MGEDGAGGIKISLFATEKDLPREINSFVKNNAYSEATDNSKAFCVDKSRKLFAVPIIEIVDAATLTERLYFYLNYPTRESWKNWGLSKIGRALPINRSRRSEFRTCTCAERFSAKTLFTP